MGYPNVRIGAGSGIWQVAVIMLNGDRFLGVDVLWALCMSFNVYLALFRGWTAQRMRAQEWKYFIGCYGAVCSYLHYYSCTTGVLVPI